MLDGMSWPAGKPRAARLPGWKEIRVHIPIPVHAALKALAKAQAAKAGSHRSISIVVAWMLTRALVPSALSEISQAIHGAASKPRRKRKPKAVQPEEKAA